MEEYYKPGVVRRGGKGGITLQPHQRNLTRHYIMNLSVEPGKRISRQAQRANTSHYSSKEVDEPSDGIVSGFEPSTEIFEEEAEARHPHPPPPPKRVQQKARKVEKVERNKQPVFSDEDLSGMILAEGTLQEK